MDNRHVRRRATVKQIEPTANQPFEAATASRSRQARLLHRDIAGVRHVVECEAKRDFAAFNEWPHASS